MCERPLCRDIAPTTGTNAPSVRDVLMKSLQPVASDLQGAVLDDCGHFLAEECPDEFVRTVTTFWSSRR
jgi:pimeloyl-ACP methyl ester carboxylesterase